MRIDAHHHLWNYNPEEYAWIDDSMATLRRDFLPSDLVLSCKEAGIDGVITVQARQTEQETAWLLSLAEQNPLMLGVVGWLPLSAEDIGERIDQSRALGKLVGLRHVLQGEPEPGYMLGAAFNRGIDALENRGLAYDILILEHQLVEALELVDRHPNQRFVLDHIAKPKIAAGTLAPWDKLLRELGRRPNVWCKLSGLVTEADPKNWSPEQLRPYMEIALEAFGSKRLMFGSDWPVCLVGVSHEGWVHTVEAFIKTLSAGEQDRFWSGNACEAYALQQA